MKSMETMMDGLDKEELVDWVGSTIFSRGKSYVDAVSELSRIEDGRLVAWVSGSEEYVTTVRRDGKGDFDYTCTCPYDYGGACKHVVAVLLAALGQLKRKQEIPLIDPEGVLYLELSDFLDDEALADDKDSVNGSGKRLEGLPGDIGQLLENKNKVELLEIVAGVVRDYPSVAKWLRDREQMATGKIDGIVHSLRKEICNLTAMDAWSSEWDDYDDFPDYSGIQQQLQALLNGGYADAVFELGAELWEKGIRQVGNSSDDGETAMGIANCMKLVLLALPDTRLRRVEQLVWLFDRLREDEYDMLYGSDELFDDERFTASNWRELASVLDERLQQKNLFLHDKWHDTYRRRDMLDQLKEAYNRANETEKIIPLLEREAEPCMAYETLVDHLIDVGEFDRARFWCIEGYGKTVEHAPGTASALKLRLEKLAEKEGKSDLVAAYRAFDFFCYPSVEKYRQLRDAAEQIDLWPAVREAAIGYLQNGKRPYVSGSAGGAWVLPEPEAGSLNSQDLSEKVSFPKLPQLIDIAIFEERNEDVVVLYGQLSQTGRCGRDISEKVADAVAESQPDISLKVWKITVDNLIDEVKTHAYQEAAGYLRKMRMVLRKTGRMDEWHAMISELRIRHKAKRRLMEVLNEVEKTGNPVD